ncbi:hypothetical protein A5703_05380 [Mycobacterium sp. E188]|nr:hypothetical protein A5703_05380 [Mycobacterium sp. E188]OBH36890.1 hypothetical protein A5691_03575 [Mycobacterium sp. E183]
MFQPGNMLANYLGEVTRAVADHLHRWNPDELLNVAVGDVVDYLVDMGSVDCPELLTDEMYQLEPTEIEQKYKDWDEIRTRRVVRLEFVVPFVGPRVIFSLQADHFSPVPPQVLQLRDHEIRLAVDGPLPDGAAIRSAVEARIREIERNLAWSRQQIDVHNRMIREQVPTMVERRRDELLATRELQADVGFPVHHRADADRFAAPVRRKAVTPRRPEPSGARARFKPEPALAEADFQDALRVLANQRNALERSPSVVTKLNEEEIRDILLVGLNSQFEGGAGGELFNGEGKTDILIRVDDRNIFIGECKVWSGPKTMDDALDQLFRYLVWRDTKAAILLFIRRQDVTAIIDKAIAKIEAHPNYKRSRPRVDGDEHFEFTMHAEDDPGREIRLVLLPFAFRAVER